MFVAAPADHVWTLAQDFAVWHPRLNIYENGPEASADLVVTVGEQNDDDRRLTYSMPQPPFPISDHRATIAIEEQTEATCYVEWSAEFESDPGIIWMLEDQLGDDIFNIALDKLATAAQDQWAEKALAS